MERLHALVAMSDPTTRALLLSLLGHSSARSAPVVFGLVQVADGEAALREFKAAPTSFDLVVLDVELAKSSGLTIARTMRAMRHDLPIIMTSRSPTNENSSLGAGASVFLVKPFSASSFVAVLRDLNDSLRRTWWPTRTGPNRRIA